MIDIDGESFVGMDLSFWNENGEHINATQLITTQLGVTKLLTAPQAPDDFARGTQRENTTPYYRFPRELFCPNCRRIKTWVWEDENNLAERGGSPRCQKCNKRSKLIPMRWVLICSDGHLSDVNWFNLAHSGSQSGCQHYSIETRELVFKQNSRLGGGLKSLSIECKKCGSNRDLDKIGSPGVVRSMHQKCAGNQPWFRVRVDEYRTVDNCQAEIAIVQRGASNVYFPSIASVLDIPSSDQRDETHMNIKNHYQFRFLVENGIENEMSDGIIRLIANETGTDIETVLLVYNNRSSVTETTEFSQEEITRQEWIALSDQNNNGNNPQFILENTSFTNLIEDPTTPRAVIMLTSYLETLTKVVKLREIRILRGFKRFKSNELVPANCSRNRRSDSPLPGIDTTGEGIFISFSEEEIQRWENGLEHPEGPSKLEERRQNSFFHSFLPKLTARFLLLHTLSHLLIRELTFKSGYSSSSIRERLYVSDVNAPFGMSGILLYTSEGDAEGTLGGLSRCGDPEVFLPLLINSLRKGTWCSLDPVCWESTSQGPDGLSLAACHACSLLAETSCQFHNCGLDRSLLIDPTYGFFKNLISEIDKII